MGIGKNTGNSACHCVHKLSISKRAINLLLRASIETTEEFIEEYESGRLQLLKGMGPKLLGEIESVIIEIQFNPEAFRAENDRITLYTTIAFVIEQCA